MVRKSTVWFPDEKASADREKKSTLSTLWKIIVPGKVLAGSWRKRSEHILGSNQCQREQRGRQSMVSLKFVYSWHLSGCRFQPRWWSGRNPWNPFIPVLWGTQNPVMWSGKSMVWVSFVVGQCIQRSGWITSSPTSQLSDKRMPQMMSNTWP